MVEYGAPDFLSLFTGASAFRAQFRSSLEDIIRRFEPRFITVKVILKDTTPDDRTLRFRIEAMIYAEPAPEEVSFDSQLDPTNQSYSVSGAVHA